MKLDHEMYEQILSRELAKQEAENEIEQFIAETVSCNTLDNAYSIFSKEWGRGVAIETILQYFNPTELENELSEYLTWEFFNNAVEDIKGFTDAKDFKRKLLEIRF